MIRKTFYIAVLLEIIFSVPCLKAQEKLQVAEKSISKTLPFSAQDELKINGDKADVNLSGWDKDYIQVKIMLSSRHQDKSVAEKELGYMKYSLTREGKQIEVINTFIIPDGVTKLQSRINVLFEIKVPAHAKILLLNKYCTVRLSDLNAEATMLMEFGHLEMSRVSGKFMIRNKFGDIQGTDISGSLNCETDKSFINLQDIKGSCMINSVLGSIDLGIHESMKSLVVKAAHTPVSINLKEISLFNYDFRTTYSSIFVPEAYRKNIGVAVLNANTFNLIQNNSKKTIKINTTYSPITLKN